MHMVERENKEPICVILSKKIALTLNQKELYETIRKLFKVIDEQQIESFDTILVKVNQHQICGIYHDLEEPVYSPSLVIVFKNENKF